MRLWKGLIFFWQLIATSVKASLSVRGAFLTQSALIIANNIIFFTMWWIFFRQFNDIAGWHLKEMASLMAIGIGAYGLMQVCFGGVRQLSRKILSGDLDPLMTQPKNLLIHLISSRSLVRGWGHLLTTLLLIVWGGLFNLSTLILVVISVISGSLVFASIGIMAHSLAFWWGPIESLSQKYFDSLFLFALYPTNIYSGFLKFLMFTLIPAGIIGYLPVELIRNFSWPQLVLLVSSSLAFWGLAFFVFYIGLKRYESGNQFGVRL